ncbi:TPA: hypothetical protein ACS70L_002886 [Providencia alcalifaciens]|jgi:tetratricopeptide (TPR) repeat protein
MQALPLEEQINSELTSILKAGGKLNDIKKATYLRDIKKLSLGIHGTYLKAMVYAASGDHALAVKYFELAIQSRDPMYYGNYIAYLDDHGAFPRLKEVSEEASDVHETSKLFAIYATESNMVSCNLSNVEKYLNRYIKLCNQEDKEMINFVSDTKIHEEKIKDFIDRAGLDECSRVNLVKAVDAILQKHNLQVDNISFVDGAYHDKYMNIMNINTKSEDAELLSLANIDLAFEMANYDSLLGKNFSIWLSSMGDA